MRGLGALVLVAMLMGVVPVLAATVDISVPLDTVVTGPAGSQYVLAVVDVPVESRGETCDATAISTNQSSEHPDSNLVVSSATSVEILDVEKTAFGTVHAGGLMTLADAITVTLTLGPDGVFSGGISVEIDCPPFATTTTIAVSPATSVAVTSTTQAAADTTVQVLDTTVVAPATSAAVSAETLPVTGPSDTAKGGVAVALVALGGLVLLAVRRREEAAVVIAEGWYNRLKTYDLKLW